MNGARPPARPWGPRGRGNRGLLHTAQHTRRSSCLHASDASWLLSVFLGMTFKYPCPAWKLEREQTWAAALREHEALWPWSVCPPRVSLPGLSSFLPALL